MRKEAASSVDTLVLLGEIVGVHGIKGLLKIKIFSADPEALIEYAPLCDSKTDKDYIIDELIPHGNIWLARIAEINDRTKAEKMRGLKLYTTRDKLPALDQKDTYYHADLVGLAAQDTNGNPMGKIIAVANFGAGDLLEIKPPKGASFYVPFINEFVPNVNIATQTVTIDPPPGLID